MSRIIMVLMVVAGFGLCSCQKNDNTAPDASKVVFNISSPVMGQVYHGGDSVDVNATVSYPGELHGYEVKITDTVTGNIVFDEASNVHSDHFDIADAFYSKFTQPLPGLKLELTVKLDDNGSIAKKVVLLQYVP